MSFHENLTDDERAKCVWVANNVSHAGLELGDDWLIIYRDGVMDLYLDGSIIPYEEAVKHASLQVLTEAYRECMDTCCEQKGSEMCFLSAYLFLENYANERDDVGFIHDIHVDLVDIPEEYR